MTATDRYPRYRAPQADGEILCVPPWPSLAAQVPHNRQTLANCDVQILDTPLSKLARAARQSLLTLARDYTQSYLDRPAIPEVAVRPLIVTGHQPELVHPGVWLKNFAAAQLARQVGGTAISLVIDSDLCRLPTVRVPTGTVDEPQIADVAFDDSQQEMPYEERTIVDRELWRSFGARATRALAPLVPSPLLETWWRDAAVTPERCDNLGLAIAQARHRLEQAWGSHSVELPFSRVCDAPPFHTFLLHLLSNASEVWRHYNGALAEYREVHHVRSDAQPLPDLVEFDGRVDGWIETPLWVWSTDDPTRRPLFVQPHSTGLRLSDRHAWQATLPPAPDDAREQLAQWRQQGIKLRTRALITTLFTRLLIADTFIHGIGGAKYDQVTDMLCQRLFGVPLPGYVTLSGTLRLPIPHATIPDGRQRELRQEMRELRFHPESHLELSTLTAEQQAQADRWIEKKRTWIATPQTTANAAERHAGITDANAALQTWLAPRREQLARELAKTRAQTRSNRLLESREYPFCLFPQDCLRDFLLDFSARMR